MQSWIGPVKPVDLTEHAGEVRLRLGVPSSFHHKWIEERLGDTIRRAVQEEVQGEELPLSIRYEVLAPSERQLDAFEPAEEKPRPSKGRVGEADPTVGSVQSVRKKDRGAIGGTSVIDAESSTGQQAEPRSEAAASPQLPPGLQRTPSEHGAFLKPPSRNHIRTLAHEAGVRLGGWNDQNTFGTFIEGDGNSLARAASIAVAENPGSSKYNPLFIYGAVGLGKTHLAQAIAHRVEESYDDAIVAYVPSNQFVEQFVQAIKQNAMQQFTLLYRSVDVLIVDDLQFLSGKEKTQEEFFHLFNELHQRGRQIVLCADRSPQQIDDIGNRLLSRFTWGLCVDVKPPDLETRIAIIHAKAESLGLNLGGRTVEWLATSIVDSIREIEGALNRLMLYSQMGEQITYEMASDKLRELTSDESRRMTVDHISETVASLWNVRSGQLYGRSRKKQIVAARHVAMYLAREMTSKSLAELGNFFGGRDHSTVLSACRSIRDRIETEPTFAQHVQQARTRLGQPSPA